MTDRDRLPIIDVAGLADPASPAAEAAARALCSAYEQVGFAYIVGHGVDPGLVRAAFAASEAFHASSMDRKMSIRINGFHRGYLAMATSTIVTSSVAKVTKPNQSESLLLMHALAPDDPRMGEPLHGPNQWPDWLPGFRPTIETYYAALEALARRLLNAFTIGLGQPLGSLDKLFEKPVTFLRMLHYPTTPPDNFGAAPHTDYGCMTILAQDRVEGLQVRRLDGSWIDAPPIEGAFVLNLGDLMPRWSNDRWVSTPHRVINRSGSERYSLPFFFDPDMDAVIDCLPGCSGPGNPPRYQPMRYGDYLLDRLSRNYNYRKSA